MNQPRLEFQSIPVDEKSTPVDGAGAISTASLTRALAGRRDAAVNVVMRADDC